VNGRVGEGRGGNNTVAISTQSWERALSPPRAGKLDCPTTSALIQCKPLQNVGFNEG